MIQKNEIEKYTDLFVTVLILKYCFYNRRRRQARPPRTVFQNLGKTAVLPIMVALPLNHLEIYKLVQRWQKM